jgi:hypothetical protein
MRRTAELFEAGINLEYLDTSWDIALISSGRCGAKLTSLRYVSMLDLKHIDSCCLLYEIMS